MALHLLRVFGALTIALFASLTPARADTIEVENAEQLEVIKRFFNASQQGYLRASRAMEDCYQDRHGRCVNNMRMAIARLPSAVRIGATGETAFLDPIRNGLFRYERTFTLLFLNALVQGNPGASCTDFLREAARPLADGTILTLAQHLDQAAADIGGRKHLPEYQLLQRVQAVLNPCAGRA
jgi:hypothetical protein